MRAVGRGTELLLLCVPHKVSEVLTEDGPQIYSLPISLDFLTFITAERERERERERDAPINSNCQGVKIAQDHTPMLSPLSKTGHLEGTAEKTRAKRKSTIEASVHVMYLKLAGVCHMLLTSWRRRHGIG